MLMLRYDSGMTQKIAISLPDDLVTRVRHEVDVGAAPSVSGFIADVLRSHFDDESWSDLVRLVQDGRPEVSAADRAWARKALRDA